MNVLFLTNRETTLRLPEETRQAEVFSRKCFQYIKDCGFEPRDAAQFIDGTADGIAAIRAQMQWADVAYVFTDLGISAAMLDFERRAERFNLTSYRKRLSA